MIFFSCLSAGKFEMQMVFFKYFFVCTGLGCLSKLYLHAALALMPSASDRNPWPTG